MLSALIILLTSTMQVVQMFASLPLSSRSYSKKGTEATQPNTPRSSSIKKQFITVITPSLQQSNFIRSVKQIKMNEKANKASTAILNLHQLLSKPKKKRSSREPMRSQDSGQNSSKGRRMQQILLENQEIFDNRKVIKNKLASVIWNAPSTPINRLLLDSQIMNKAQ